MARTSKAESRVQQASEANGADDAFDPSRWLLDGIDSGTRLFDDVGFLYELELAKREIWPFLDDLDRFHTRAAYFEEVGGKTSHHKFISDLKGKGQIGRTNQYLTHWWYPYKAKFHPQMVKALINWMGVLEGETILDPFCGSGTALVEAKTMGIDSVGVDLNPLCRLVSQVKCDLLDLDPTELMRPDREKVLLHFDQKLGKLSNARRIGHREVPLSSDAEIEKDPRIYGFFKTAYLYALSDYSYVNRPMREGFEGNIGDLIPNLVKFDVWRHDVDLHLGGHRVVRGNAKSLDLPDSSIHGVVSSPPYSIAVDYIENDAHALPFFGEDPDKLRQEMVGLRGPKDERVRLYYEDMRAAFSEMFRVLQSGRKCVIVVGDNTVGGKRLNNCEMFIEMAKSIGFDFVRTIRRPILGGFARLRYEYMILFSKP